MRSLVKRPEPPVLTANKETWDAELAANPANSTAKYRYRNANIKNELLIETGRKCVYCESRIGHNTPGDVEHKAPSSVYPALHFDWQNLTIACTECNRRKGAYDTLINPFVDPYDSDVERRIIHHGPIVVSLPADVGAEIYVRLLELDGKRIDLVKRKIEKIIDINDLKCRIADCKVPFLKMLLQKDLERRSNLDEEFSGMVKSLI